VHKIEINGHVLELFQTIGELPARRYSLFQKYTVMESGIGSDINAVGGHFAKLFEFIAWDMKEDATRETKNLYYNFFTMLETLYIPGLAFCCTLYRVDGIEVTDVSEEALKKRVQELSDWGLTHDTCTEWIDGFKKKIYNELKQYFPGYFNDEETIEYYGKIKSRILAVAEAIEATDIELVERKLRDLDKYFTEQLKPQDFDAESELNASVQADLTFETLCGILESNGVSNAGELTTMQFYSRLEYFRKLHQSIKKP